MRHEDYLDVFMLCFGSISFIVVGTMLWDDLVIENETQELMFPT